MTEKDNCISISGDGMRSKAVSTMNNLDASQSALRDSTLMSNTYGGSLGHLKEMLNFQGKRGLINDLKGNTPTIPINDLRGEESIRYARDERHLRCQLSALCRLVDLNGWTQSIYNHVSAKCSPEEYLVNPFGLLFHEVQASTLVKLKENGCVVDSGSTVLGVNKAGWNLHSAVHTTRGDVNCVAHLHLPDVVAVSCIKSGLLPISPEATELLPSVRYHNYAGFATDSAETEAIRADLGTGKVLFLRNKGVAIAASTIHETWYLIKRVVSACQTQMRLLQLGCGMNLLNEFILSSTKNEETDSVTATQNESGGDHHAPNGDVVFAAVPFSLQTHSSGDVTVNAEYGANDLGARSISSGFTDVSGWGIGEMEFEAQMRMLDSAGYRTGYVYRNPKLLRHLPVEMPWSSGTTPRQLIGDLSATGFLSDAMVTTVEDVDDVTAATNAGAMQMKMIANNVRSNKEKGFQRNQWLSRSGTDRLFAPLSCTADTYHQSTPMNGRCSLGEKNGRNPSDSVAIPSPNLTSSSGLEKTTPSRRSGRKNKMSSFSSNKWSKFVNGVPEFVIEEPRTPPTPRSEFVSRSASLPAHARNATKFAARSSNTLEPIDGALSDDEECKLKAEKKKKTKWGTFRFPTFKKKSKPTPPAV